MKKINLLIFTILFLSMSFIKSFAAIDESTALANLFTTWTPANSAITNMATYIDNAKPNWWNDNYYLISVQGTSSNIELRWWVVAKNGSQITEYTSSASNYTSTTTQTSVMYNVTNYYFNSNGNYTDIYITGNTNALFTQNNIFGEMGIIVYTNVPIRYQTGASTYLEVEPRYVPWNAWPTSNPYRIEPITDVSIDNLDNQTQSNVYFTAILDSFDFDSFYIKLTSVVNVLFDKFQQTFNSVVSVFDYITNSISSVNSFINSNYGIVSLISLTYSAIPSVLRNVFILALSSSVIFIMLRRVM